MGGKLGTHRSSLDGLRGIAIAMVVGYHAFGWPENGRTGVDLFFILSGFLITTLLLEEHARVGRVSLTAFYIRRVRRLFPALALLISVFLTVAIVKHERTAEIGSLLALTSTANIAIAWNLTPVNGGIGHLWSLATEDQFYLLWPALLFIVLKARRPTASIVLLAGILVMMWNASNTRGFRGEMGPDVRPTGLLLGCLVALAWTSDRTRHQLRRGCLILLPLALPFAVLLTLSPTSTEGFTREVPVFNLCCAVILVCALETGVARPLSWKPLQALGLISYSLYLWHLPFLLWAGTEGSFTPLAVLMVAVAVVAAAASYRFVEQPFRRRRADAASRRREPAITPDPATT